MFLNYATLGAFMPLFSLRLVELHFTPVEVGWACATQALAALVAPLVAGQAADRYFPAQHCLTVCAFLGSGLLWFLAGLTTPLAIFGTSLAIWMVLGPANTLCASLCFAHLPSPERDYGPVRMWGTVGWVAAGWALGFWLYRPDWFVSMFAWMGLDIPPASLADIFRLGSLLAFALGTYSLWLPHTPPQNKTTAWLAPLAAFRILRGRSFLIYWACSFGVCVTIPFMMQLAPLLLEHLGVPVPWLGPTMTLAQSMEIVFLAMLPMLLLRLSTRGTMLLGLVAWLLLLSGLTVGEPTWLVAASLSLNGLCICCFIVAGQVFVNSRAHGDVRASAQALLSFINGLGMLTGNLLVGWVRQEMDQEFPPTFAVGAAIAGFLVVLFFCGFTTDRPHPD